ncbi:hypothetical protein BH10BDE1_BH10BDE1_27570 [soil metagenome]
MKFRRVLRTVLLPMLLLSTAACMGVDKKTKAEVNEKVAQETATQRPGELSERAFAAWATSSGMSDTQRTQMIEIQMTAERTALRIRREISKTKSAMFKELATGTYNDRIINGFRSKIVKLDHEGLDGMFKALARARSVLGESENSKRYFEYMDMIETRDMAGL